MIKQYTYNLVLKHSAGSVAKKGSKYAGGFVMKNGRKNNSKEYNHDYYMKNKDKWGSSNSSGGRNFSYDVHGRPQADPTATGSVTGRPAFNLYSANELLSKWREEDPGKYNFVTRNKEFESAMRNYNTMDRLYNDAMSDTSTYSSNKELFREHVRATAERRYDATSRVGYTVDRLGKEYDERKKSDKKRRFYNYLNKKYKGGDTYYFPFD